MDLPIKNCEFSIVMLVYQRVNCYTFGSIASSKWDCHDI
jgi:hypothetical protein